MRSAKNVRLQMAGSRLVVGNSRVDVLNVVVFTFLFSFKIREADAIDVYSLAGRRWLAQSALTISKAKEAPEKYHAVL